METKEFWIIIAIMAVGTVVGALASYFDAETISGAALYFVGTFAFGYAGADGYRAIRGWNDPQ